jgi:HK97 family phage major capsid protein
MELSEIKTALDGFTSTVDKRLKAVTDENTELRDRLEELEAKGKTPGKTSGSGDGAYTRDQLEHKTVFVEWLRKPTDISRKQRLEEAQREMETKDVSIGTPSAGGYAVPTVIGDAIEKRVALVNPFRSLVRVQQIGTSNYTELVDLRGESVGWSSETGSRSGTNTPTLLEVAPTMGELYALPTVTEWSLDDIFFDVQNWLVTNVSDEMAAQEADAIVSGNGSDKPSGFLNTTPVSTSDDGSPVPGATALQYLPGLAGSPSALNGDLLIDLAVGAIKDRYLQPTSDISWVMSSATLARVRKLKSSGGGDYLWQPSLIPGTPSTLLGYPVYTTSAMPAWSSNLFPIAFGNFRRGYLLVDRLGLRVTVDPYSTPGKVRFYIRRRVGGKVLNRQAIKLLKVATS